LKFQSAPHFSSEANNSEDCIDIRRTGFNPRLTSAARRTYQTAANGNDRVSIRASLQQRGEHLLWAVSAVEMGFNPRLTSAARRTSTRDGEPIKRLVEMGFNPRLTSAARRT